GHYSLLPRVLERGRTVAAGVVSMSGGVSGSADSPARPSGDGGEWRRIYDRVESMLPRVEALAADRARLDAAYEAEKASDSEHLARLLQAEASRSRWKAAYMELPPGANPKLAELQENDLEDSRDCEHLIDIENSQLK
ncbi:hypothetical protein BRADI_1g77865v3, partial [Brachypodium distachyon]